MKSHDIAFNIANGTVYFSHRSDNISQSSWIAHPTFRGVRLKHMITGADTAGVFSSHLVTIDTDCCLEAHCHDDQLELHEVIQGEGVCHFAEQALAYRLGTMAVIPKGERHMIQAGGNGLVLLAKFFPALV
ncbi:MAG: AraC family ligand binding domain-containing protein [Desulfobulbus sp.]|nr:AraC family ligand binding domain-containing protein [Desulfobulbus sp.]